jgi:hypothetical protein
MRIGPRLLATHWQRQVPRSRLEQRRGTCTACRAQREIRGCLVCARIFFPGESFFSCCDCAEKHDACTGCTAAGTRLPKSRTDTRPHRMQPDQLDLLFAVYAPRRCLGKRRREESTGGLLPVYDWSTYADVGTSAFALGTALLELLAEIASQRDEPSPMTAQAGVAVHGFVGVLGSMCLEVHARCMTGYLTLHDRSVSSGS